MQNMDPAYQKQSEEIETAARFYTKSRGGLEKSQQENPV